MVSLKPELLVTQVLRYFQCCAGCDISLAYGGKYIGGSEFSLHVLNYDGILLPGEEKMFDGWDKGKYLPVAGSRKQGAQPMIIRI